jgi:hypothetical protein
MGVNIIAPKKEDGATTGQAASIITDEDSSVNLIETDTTPADLIQI